MGFDRIDNVSSFVFNGNLILSKKIMELLSIKV